MSSRLAKVVDEMLAFNSPVFRSPQSALVSLKQAASAKTEALVTSLPTVQTARKPANTKVELIRGLDSLQLMVPADGMSSSTLSTGGFTVAWNFGIGMWTVSAITGGAPLLFTAFSIPFWIVGARLARDTFKSALVGVRLNMDRDEFSLREEIVGGTEYKVRSGKTSDLTEVDLFVSGYINENPVRCIRMVAGAEVITFGQNLELAEQDWIVSEIRNFLEL
mmetsp:Transcript_4414/g.16092  ORF Transcript_4414/g.16092 Transcript_4414/m.16092 type:complete len:221 (-) Transcript_4414:714-1376(-)